jgi:hypothetical protein
MILDVGKLLVTSINANRGKKVERGPFQRAALLKPPRQRWATVAAVIFHGIRNRGQSVARKHRGKDMTDYRIDCSTKDGPDPDYRLDGFGGPHPDGGRWTGTLDQVLDRQWPPLLGFCRRP